MTAAGAAVLYRATASPELAALDARRCASIAAASCTLIPTFGHVLGTSRRQYSLPPDTRKVPRFRLTPHVTHLKQPLW